MHLPREVRRGWRMGLLGVVGLGLGVALAALVPPRVVPNACAMTYMRPAYEPVGVGGAGGRSGASSPPPYRLVRYLEGGGGGGRRGGDADAALVVLFVPGSGGSAEQVRSLGKELARRDKASAVYAVDAREQLSAFSAALADAQAGFVREAVEELAARRHPGARLAVVGHSVGGLVAAKGLAGVEHDVAALVVLAAPIAAHPMDAHPAVAAWAAEARAGLNEHVLVSVSGGVRDVLVPDWYAAVPEGHPAALAVEAGRTRRALAAHKGALSADHQCIVWCNEVVQAVADGLVGLSRLPRGAERAARLAALAEALLPDDGAAGRAVLPPARPDGRAPMLHELRETGHLGASAGPLVVASRVAQWVLPRAPLLGVTIALDPMNNHVWFLALSLVYAFTDRAALLVDLPVFVVAAAAVEGVSGVLGSSARRVRVPAALVVAATAACCLIPDTGVAWLLCSGGCLLAGVPSSAALYFWAAAGMLPTTVATAHALVVGGASPALLVPTLESVRLAAPVAVHTAATALRPEGDPGYHIIVLGNGLCFYTVYLAANGQTGSLADAVTAVAVTGVMRLWGAHKHFEGT